MNGQKPTSQKHRISADSLVNEMGDLAASTRRYEVAAATFGTLEDEIGDLAASTRRSYLDHLRTIETRFGSEPLTDATLSAFLAEHSAVSRLRPDPPGS